MRFDDTLETVLAGDLSTSFGMQSAWRQLVDLIGRRRVPADSRALSLLRRIRPHVPPPVRAASARGLELADPPAPLVRLFALDEIAIALPVLRTARIPSAEWIQMLPDLAPAARAVLRNRRDLSPIVRRALETYGPIDFVLPDQSVKPEPAIEAVPAAEPVAAEAPLIAEATPEAVAEPEFVPEPVAIEPVLVEPEPVTELAVPESDVLIPVAEDIALPALEAPEPVAVSPEPIRMRLVAEEIAEPAVPLPAQPVVAEEVAFPVIEPATEAPAPVPVAEPEPVRPPENIIHWPEVLDSPMIAAAARTESRDSVESAPIAAPAIVPAAEVAVSAEPIEIEEDFSFVALAGLAPAIANTTVVTPVQNELQPERDQTGTVGSDVPEQVIAEAPAPAQGSPMSGETISVEAAETARPPEPEPVLEPKHDPVPAAADETEGPFQIAEVVARIDAFWRNREEGAETPHRAARPAPNFRFETDAKGVIRWVEGASRAPIVGLSLDFQGAPGTPDTSSDAPVAARETSRVDGVAAGAFRNRAGFSNARMAIEGDSDAAGQWLISAIPVFDPANGRFTGYRGTARRPRADERAEPVRPAPAAPSSSPDSLRQLVHELRTPTNAIAGFAEMIETQMLGPVSGPYRDRATTIRAQARELLGAIDDLDLAARIDSDALALVPGRIALRPVLANIADDLAQLAELRGSAIALPVDDLAVTGDRRAVERLLARLMATLVSASGEGERIGVRTALETDDKVAITIDRPNTLAEYPGDSVLGIDDEREDSTLLGTGFALRLARNLARELGGSLVIEPESLTLRLPAAVNAQVGQANLN